MGAFVASSSLRRAGCCAILLVGLTACGDNDDGGPPHWALGGPVRQADAAGVALPFTVTNPLRWNTGNDGTDFEPCTGFTADQLTVMRLDPASVTDADDPNDRGGRGCTWTYLTRAAGKWTATVTVTDVQKQPTPLTLLSRRCTVSYPLDDAVVEATVEGPLPADELHCTLAGFLAMATKEYNSHR